MHYRESPTIIGQGTRWSNGKSWLLLHVLISLGQVSHLLSSYFRVDRHVLALPSMLEFNFGRLEDLPSWMSITEVPLVMAVTIDDD